MATKSVEETARLTITCDSSKTCSVKVKGDREILTAALACLMDEEDENNEFREMMSLAIQVVLYEEKRKKKKSATKKKK